MENLAGKVAVVTGAASGIGRALAEQSAKEGMHIVLADVEESALSAAASQLASAGADVLSVRTDVSSATDVEALAQRAVDHFGGVHLLFNNAGVHAGGTLWESTLADWQWVLGVNLWGVIHGLRAFVPIMLAQKTECHIVNTASASGLMPTPGWGIYGASKAAIISLSETLQYEFMIRGANIGVSVLCPGGVNTRLLEAERNRPAALQNAPGETSTRVAAADAAGARAIQHGMAPEDLAKRVFAGIKGRQLYIVTHRDYEPMIRRRMDQILAAHESCE